MEHMALRKQDSSLRLWKSFDQAYPGVSRVYDWNFPIFTKKLIMPFTSLGLSDELLQALNEQHFTTPTAIQIAAIPAILTKKDVLGIAETGTGKTAGYVLPVLMNLQQELRSNNRQADVLVLVPTRELAEQVKGVFQVFARALPERLKTIAVYGGVSINPQMMGMQGVNILIATPGRLLELIDSNAVDLSAIKALVLDEADKLLNPGFKEELNRIISFLPQKRQNILFSATLSNDLENIGQLLLDDPVLIEIEKEKTNLELINQIAYIISDAEKGPFLRYLIKYHQMKQVLVFASSVATADAIVNKLRKNNFDARAIHSKKSQGTRTDTLHHFKSGSLRILVATDLMARGIDITDLPFVINYELPRSPKDYVHRIGRTGRAGSSGMAISLLSHKDLHHFEVIQKKMGKTVELIDGKSLL
jgi:ATP-dependent RNA helicase RhlE